jgi:hypothetical protein
MPNDIIGDIIPQYKVTPPSLPQSVIPPRIISYIFNNFCNVCLECHPRKATYYLIPPFIGPKLPKSVPTWLTAEYLLHPTSYWPASICNDRDNSLDPIYAGKDQGNFLTPLLDSFTPDTPPWIITFRFESCDGVRKWILTVLAMDVQVYLNIFLFLCRSSRDYYLALKLEWRDPDSTLPPSEWTKPCP